MNRRRSAAELNKMPGPTKAAKAAYMRDWYRKNRAIVLARLMARRKGLPLPPKRPTVTPAQAAAAVALRAIRNNEKAERRIGIEARKAANKLRRAAKTKEWNRKRLLKGVPVEIQPMRLALADFRSMTSGRNKLVISDVETIKSSVASARQLAEKYGVSKTLIDLIRRGRIKKWTTPHHETTDACC